MRLPKNECTCENCTCKNVDADLEYIHEETLGLAEDIMELDDRLDSTLDIIKGMCDNCIKMVDLIRLVDEKIADVERSNRNNNDFVTAILAVLFVSVLLLALHAFNVF